MKMITLKLTEDQARMVYQGLELLSRDGFAGLPRSVCQAADGGLLAIDSRMVAINALGDKVAGKLDGYKASGFAARRPA
jgi:hypothetical protein